MVVYELFITSAPGVQLGYVRIGRIGLFSKSPKMMDHKKSGVAKIYKNHIS